MFLGEKALTVKQQRLWQLLAFLARLLAMVVPLYLIISLGISMLPLQLEVARESRWALGSLGINATLEGAGIKAGIAGRPEFFFVITEDCTGWKDALFLAALVLAVPGRKWKHRFAGIAAGFALLWLLNIARVAAVVFAYSSYGYDAAMLLHDYLWQAGMGAAALAIWAVWLKCSSNR